MTNAAVPTPPRPSTHGAKGRQCPDDLWKLGERAVTRARRWADESAHEPTPQSAKLLSRILADPDGLTFTTRFVDDVVRPVDLDVASAALQIERVAPGAAQRDGHRAPSLPRDRR